VERWFKTVWYGPEMRPAKPVDPIRNAQRIRR
jgi:hypothetical protein